MATTNNPLMTFRTAYLRAIGVIWNRPATDTLVTALLNPIGGNALPVMEAAFGTRLPWNAVVRLGLNSVAAKRPQWRPRISGGWVGGEDHHTITIFVPSHECVATSASTPPAPATAIASEQEALAAYYDLSPTLFGTSEPTAVPGSGGPGTMTFDIKLGTMEPFEQFGGVFMRMLALLWKVPTETALANVPTDLFGATPDVVFQRWLGYRWPWNMDMVFVKCTPVAQPLAAGGYVKYAMRWQSSATAGTTTSLGRWEFALVNQTTGALSTFQPGLPPNEIFLSIPDNPMTDSVTPVRDVAIEPLALAAYNQTGECYPLTCCGC